MAVQSVLTVDPPLPFPLTLHPPPQPHTPHTTLNEPNRDVLRNECFKREQPVGEALRGLYRDEGMAFLHRYRFFFVVSN